MSITARSQRATLRWSHLVVGVALATYAYLPPGQFPALRWALMTVGVPAVSVTGAWMWKQAAIRRGLSQRRARQAERRARLAERRAGTAERRPMTLTGR